PATLSGNIVTLTGSGMITITASQMGNNIYDTAASVTQSFVVSSLNIAIANPARLSDGSFAFEFSGTLGNNYGLQVSADLTNWTSLFSFTCTNLPTPVTDTAATNYNQRFYRVLGQ